jgi:hypothetical protein
MGPRAVLGPLYGAAPNSLRTGGVGGRPGPEFERLACQSTVIRGLLLHGQTNRHCASSNS